jgi:hypothetical protein
VRRERQSIRFPAGANGAQTFGHDAPAEVKPPSPIIAQPFMAGNNATQITKSRQGRQTNSFVPDGTWNIPEP